MTGPTLEEICAVRTDDDWARLMLRKFRPTLVQLDLVIFAADQREHEKWVPAIVFGDGPIAWELLEDQHPTSEGCFPLLLELAEFVSFWLPGGFPEERWPGVVVRWGGEGIDCGGIGWPS